MYVGGEAGWGTQGMEATRKVPRAGEVWREDRKRGQVEMGTESWRKITKVKPEITEQSKLSTLV